MIALQDIHFGRHGLGVLRLDQLEATHGVSGQSARIYTRFFGQQTVQLYSDSHRDMLLGALSGLVASNPGLRDQDGYGIYTKTQTHNTFFEQDWLADVFATVGLAHWEVLTFSMTNCASSLAAVHFGASLEKPFILMSGEKAFHPAGSRLSVGLLGEAAVCALFASAGGYVVKSTHVSHLPRFHLNPDDMAGPDKKALQTAFEAGLIVFLCDLVKADPSYFAQGPCIVPYNLNPPLVLRALQAAGLDHNILPGPDNGVGHMFCSDNFLKLATHPPASGAPVFLFAAGHGVTFAAIKLEPHTQISH